LHIEFETFQFYTEFVGAVLDSDFAEVRLSGFRAQAGELRAADCNDVVPLRAWIFEQLQFFPLGHWQVSLLVLSQYSENVAFAQGDN
jgi:hypothetical protein